MRSAGSKKYASSLAIMKSQIHASISPPAIQAPWDCGNHRLWNFAPAAAHAEIKLPAPAHRAFLHRTCRSRPPATSTIRDREVRVPPRTSEVVTTGKVFAGAEKHYRLNLVVVGCAHERIVKGVSHLIVLRVVVSRSIHCHDSDNCHASRIGQARRSHRQGRFSIPPVCP